MSNAINCPRDGCENPATHHPTFGVLPCKYHREQEAKATIKRPPEFVSLSKHDRINADRDAHLGDIEQPWIGNKPNPRFAKIYPDLAPNYFTPEELKNME